MTIKQNSAVLIQNYWVNKIFCWHGKKHLKFLGADNGAEIYCGKCYLKRFGYMTTDRENIE